MRQLFCTSVLLLVGACAPPAPPQAELDQAKQAAVALVNEWAAAGSEGRWDDLAAVYADTPDFTWVEQGAIPYPDHTAIVAGIARARDSGVSVRTTVSDVQAFAISPDAATVRANAALAFGDPAAGGFALSGILTAIAIKQDRRWVFLQGHLSSPPQPPRQ